MLKGAKKIYGLQAGHDSDWPKQWLFEDLRPS